MQTFEAHPDMLPGLININTATRLASGMQPILDDVMARADDARVTYAFRASQALDEALVTAEAHMTVRSDGNLHPFVNAIIPARHAGLTTRVAVLPEQYASLSTRFEPSDDTYNWQFARMGALFSPETRKGRISGGLYLFEGASPIPLFSHDLSCRVMKLCGLPDIRLSSSMDERRRYESILSGVVSDPRGLYVVQDMGRTSRLKRIGPLGPWYAIHINGEEKDWSVSRHELA